MGIAELRKEYHHRICRDIIRINANKKGEEFPNFADGSNKGSVESAWGIVHRLGCAKRYEKISGQTAGRLFEQITKDFLEKAFGLLHHLRPGEWCYSIEDRIANFAQYVHLARFFELVKGNSDLESTVGQAYIVTPDIVIGRMPVSDDEVNRMGRVVSAGDPWAIYTPLRKKASDKDTWPILHASISCKWTLRSDRAQNARAEALNLIRDRKGNLPHVVAVTGEPQPTRIAALALGTGDLDCVYHFALSELQGAIERSDCAFTEPIGHQV
jgi:hypothetical protein